MTLRLRVLPAVLAALVLGMLAPTVTLAAGPGAPDASFGSGGTTASGSATRFFGAAIDSAGRLLVAGEQGIGSSVGLVVSRFSAAGTPDTSFGSGGSASGPAVATASGSSSFARAVAVQSDGKIVVVGTATDGSGFGTAGIVAERFTANGALDTSFGTGGVVNLLSTASGDGYAVAIQSDGKILVGGSANLGGSGGTTPRAAIARLTAAGGLDTSFGSGGIAQLDLGSYSVVHSIAVQSDGRILIAGSQSPGGQVTNALLARLTSGGALDPSFNGTGAVAAQYARGGGAFSSLNGVAIQPDGKIVAAGGDADGSGFDAFVVRFDTAGHADASFGASGVAYQISAQSSAGGITPGANAVTVAGNGDVVAAGTVGNGLQTQGALWAFTASGAPDPAFGTGGVVKIATGGASSEISGLAQAPNGNLSVAGDAQSGFAQPFSGLAGRFIGLGPAPAGPKPPPTPTPTPKPPALKLTVGSIARRTKTSAALKSGLSEKAGCNKACSLHLTASISAGTARSLHLGTTARRCKKVKGHKRCRKVVIYKTITLGTTSAQLRAAGSRTLTVKINRRYAKALSKARGLTVVLGTTAKNGREHRSVNKSTSLHR